MSAAAVEVTSYLYSEFTAMNLHQAPKLKALHVLASLPPSLKEIANHFSRSSGGYFSLYPHVENILAKVHVEVRRAEGAAQPKEANLATITTILPRQLQESLISQTWDRTLPYSWVHWHSMAQGLPPYWGSC
jgi:hypothetical protein